MVDLENGRSNEFWSLPANRATLGFMKMSFSFLFRAVSFPDFKRQIQRRRQKKSLSPTATNRRRSGMRNRTQIANSNRNRPRLPEDFQPRQSFGCNQRCGRRDENLNAADGNLISAFGSEKDKNFAVAWNAESDAVVTISPKVDARFWDARSGKILFSLEKSQATSVVFSPDGKSLATIHRDDKKQLAQIWNAEDGKLLATLPREKGEDRAFSLVCSPDGKCWLPSSNEVVKFERERRTASLSKVGFSGTFQRERLNVWRPASNDTGYVWQIGEN